MAPTPPYVELHCHSAYSFLDGASLPQELAQRASELGHSALALTDHNSVAGSMELAMAAREHGVRPIHGAEIDVAVNPAERGADGAGAGGSAAAGSRHITLLVRDGRGWSNLCRIITRAHAHTRDGPHRRNCGAPAVDLQCVLDHAEGLVCLTGCAERSLLAPGREGEAIARRLLEAFGVGRLRVELQRPYARHDRARNRALTALGRRLGVACVASGNIHAHARSRAELQDAFVTIANHTTLDASEPLRRGNHSHVMTTPQAMASRFADHPEAVRESILLAEQLTFDLTKDLGYRYPGAEDTRAGRRLAELCTARLQERYRSPLRAEAQGRLTQELDVIADLGLAGFFLLHHDMLELSREVAREVRGPDSVRALLAPGRGRGSSVSSLVCYLIGLSHIDPIANRLALGRFLHEDLCGLPDIDLDFPRDIREALIPRVHERYGRDRSALVAAFPTFRARGAIRELGKALGLPPGEIERVARGSEGWDARHVDFDIESALGVRATGGEALPPDPRVVTSRDPHDPWPPPPGPQDRPRPALRGRWAWLARLAAEAHGLPRHLSQHSGGMIVATRPLIDCCPVVPAAMEGRQIAQWDKDSCADAGFLKIDLLGLGMLSAVERCVETIARTRGERIDLSRIPYDDPATYEAIQRADTTGVFQIESRAQMQSLYRTRPETLQDITIQVAIVRPGPIQGGAVNPYITRRQRLRIDPDYQVPCEHPSLEPVLKETLGTIIFQDQVLEVAIAFAGFSPGEAEGLRRAMSRKRSEAAIEAYHRRFVAGAQAKHGVDEELAERVFSMVQGFSGFGFPKAHGAAFGLLAYQSTWLRVHYGPELLCALLNEQPMGFYPSDALVHEAQRRGVEVLAPDVNRSGAECEIEIVEAEPPAGASRDPVSRLRVRIGLGYVRGVREQEVRDLVGMRETVGPFRSLSDLAARAGTSVPSLELLAWSGACDSLVESGSPVSARRLALWQLGVATPGKRVRGGTQLALPLDLPAPPPLRELSRWEAMLADYGTTGLTASTHPLALLRSRLPADAVTSRDLEVLRHASRVRVGGLVVARQRPGTARGIVFVLLEDEHGTINLIIPPAVYERQRLTVRTEPLVFVQGRLERLPAAGGAINVMVDRIDSIAAPDRLLAQVKDFSLLDERELERLREGAEKPSERAAGASGAGPAEDFRSVAPPVMSFASGRRR